MKRTNKPQASGIQMNCTDTGKHKTAQHFAYMYMIVWRQQQSSHSRLRPTCWMVSGFTYIVIASGCYGNGRQCKRAQQKEKRRISFEVGNASLVRYLGRGREEAREAASELLIDGSLLWRWSTHLARRYKSTNNETGSSGSNGSSNTHTGLWLWSKLHLFWASLACCLPDKWGRRGCNTGAAHYEQAAASQIPVLSNHKHTHTQGVEERGREGEGGEREGNKKGRKGIGQKSKKHVIKIRQCGHTLTIQISMHACNVWQALWRCVCKPHWAFFPLQVLLSQWLFSEWRHKPAPCCQHWFGEPQSRSSASTIHHQDAKRKKNTKSPIT